MMVQIVTGGMLESLGCEVTIAGTGSEAIKTAIKNSYDIILLDLGLPDLHGKDVSLRLRQHGIRTPIVALTGRTSEEEGHNCFDARMDDFLQKPADLDMLKFILNKHLSKVA